MMPFKKFWNLAVDANDSESLNMYIYGEICAASSFFGSEDDVVASRFVEDLNHYQGIKNINVYINSPGGSVFAAAAIINQLRKHPACIHTWCDGICASAAVGILMAADEGCRHMSRASLLMIHNPSTSAQGDQAVFLKAADLLAKVKTTLLNIYHDRTGLSVDQLSDMMDAETYLDADEALQYNFIDKITEDKVTYNFQDESTFVCNGVTMDIAAELNIQELKAHLEKLAEQSVNSNLEKGGTSIMSFEELMASLAEEQRTLIQGEIESRISAREEQLAADRDAAVNSIQDKCMQLEDQVNELQQQLASAAAPQVTAEEALLANVSDDVKALLAQARADAVNAQQALAQLQAQNEFAAFKATFSEFAHLPIQEEHIKAMQQLSKNNEAMYNELRNILKVADNAMSAGFVPVGTDGGSPVATSAIDVMEQRIAEYQTKNAGASYNQALQAVLREDPSLYDSYRQGFNVE